MAIKISHDVYWVKPITSSPKNLVAINKSYKKGILTTLALMALSRISIKISESTLLLAAVT
jgi:hypothetical protein